MELGIVLVVTTLILVKLGRTCLIHYQSIMLILPDTSCLTRLDIDGNRSTEKYKNLDFSNSSNYACGALLLARLKYAISMPIR